MKKLLCKEFCLATPKLTYFFLAFTLMTFLPGYPILCGAFFVCFGLFQGYQLGREDNDILYSVLLPVAKRDVVKAKYIFAVLIQLIAFLLCAIFTMIRMTALAEAGPYVTNALMAANFTFLGFVFLIFTVFNVIFIGGFFKTAYAYGKPFIIFIIVNFTVIGIAEALHHFPGMAFWNAVSGDAIGIQVVFAVLAMFVYIGGTFLSCKVSQKRFELLDL